MYEIHLTYALWGIINNLFGHCLSQIAGIPSNQDNQVSKRSSEAEQLNGFNIQRETSELK